MIYVVAHEGGDFTSIQAAVDAVPQGGRSPVIILVRMEEFHERVIVNKDNLRIIGEARDRTILTNSGCAKDLDENGNEKGTFLSYTMLITGRNVEVENITIRNDAGDGHDVGQALAVYAAGDRGVFRNVKMIAHQDTLFCGPVNDKVKRDALPHDIAAGVTVDNLGNCPYVYGRQYFEDCFIQGDVDFIFGPYRCWFERCTLMMNARGGIYTAANTPEESPYGFVFRNCLLTGECEPGKAVLGRPWRAFARTVFINCEMDEHVSPQGFADWVGGAPVTNRYAEFGTSGARADQSARHPAQKRMTAQEAAYYTIAEVLGGYDGWNPQKRTPTWFMCGDSTMCEQAREKAPLTGWGQALTSLAPAGVFVCDCAISGRSSKSFVAEKQLSFVELCLRRGDTLLIQFSHNDEKPDLERATSPRGTYPLYLSMYIDAARRQGATPVLISPLARRHFDERGALKHTHGDYPDAMKNLAQERGVAFIGLEKETERILCSISQEETKTLYNWLPKGYPNYPDGASDDTHLSLTGAVTYAQAFLRLYAEAGLL